MKEMYIQCNRIIRSIHALLKEMEQAYNYESDGIAVGCLSSVFNRQLGDLKRVWPNDLDDEIIHEIGATLAQKMPDSLWKIGQELLPDLEDSIDKYYSAQSYSEIDFSIIDLLHSRIVVSAYAQFRSGLYRDAVLNSVIAVFDYLRERSGLESDGAKLAAEALSVENPRIVLSSLENESGRNEQKGFLQIFQGYYLGVRNPKAHSLAIKPTKKIAAQYLVFSSLLCRRIEQAQIYVVTDTGDIA